MKKILSLLFMAFFAIKAFAQDYSGLMEVNTGFGKNDQGTNETRVNLRCTGVYQWLFYGIGHEQLTKKSTTDLEKITRFTLGGGHIMALGTDMNLTAGIGVTGLLSPQIGSSPKKSDTYWGGTAYGHLTGKDEGIDGEVELTYVLLPTSSSGNTWSKGLFMPRVRLMKFMGDVFALGLEFNMKMINWTERQVQGQQFNGGTMSQTESEFSPFIGAKAKNTIFKFGLALRRSRQSSSQAGQLPVFNSQSLPIGFNIGVIFKFEH